MLYRKRKIVTRRRSSCVCVSLNFFDFPSSLELEIHSICAKIYQRSASHRISFHLSRTQRTNERVWVGGWGGGNLHIERRDSSSSCVTITKQQRERKRRGNSMIFICWGYYIRKSFPFQLFFPPPYIKQQQRVTYCTSYPPPFAWSIHAAFISILIA